jgi:hypothetical protein
MNSNFLVHLVESCEELHIENSALTNAVFKSFDFLANFNSVWSGYKVSYGILDLTKLLIRFADSNYMTFDTHATRNISIVLSG